VLAQPAAESAPQPSLQSEPPAAAPSSGASADDAATLPDYTGAPLDRHYLSGDWDGTRTSLADKGLTFDIAWTHIGQGVVAGGFRRDWDYGANLDAALTADLDRMGLAHGGTLVIRGESRYGETVNDDSGAFTPVNTRGYYPLTDEINQAVPFTITELTYTLSPTDTLDVIVGKLLMAAGDPTEFAVNPGRTQFLNSNFVSSVATSQTTPYSTLGAEVDWSPAPWIALSTAVYQTADSSTTTGFDNLNEGWTWWMEADTQYRLGTLPGGLNAGVVYAFAGEFTNIGGTLTLFPEDGLIAETVSDSWAVYASAWQYLFTFDPAPPTGEIDASDGHADLRGLGLFTRIGFGDPNSNPVEWSLSAGVGARGLIPGRDSDTLGVAYYYTEVRSSEARSFLGIPSSTRGFEAYYNVALTPAMGLTFDVQWIDEGFIDEDAATILGCRLDIEF
jgi:porin